MANIVRRHKRGLWGSCALDVADMEKAPSDRDICTYLGIPAHSLAGDVADILDSANFFTLD